MTLFKEHMEHAASFRQVEVSVLFFFVLIADYLKTKSKNSQSCFTLWHVGRKEPLLDTTGCFAVYSYFFLFFLPYFKLTELV